MPLAAAKSGRVSRSKNCATRPAEAIIDDIFSCSGEYAVVAASTAAAMRLGLAATYFSCAGGLPMYSRNALAPAGLTGFVLIMNPLIGASMAVSESYVVARA